jgi:hypothetical protein
MSRRTLESLGLDRWLLFLVFAAGAGGVVGMKLAGLAQWAPALWSGGIIIGYAASVWAMRSARLEPEQIGDNAYYLGFVLTLCSLAYTLWTLGTVEAEAAFIAEVVAGFGVALTSTVVGVAVRVFLMQFRLDLVAREREAQMALGEAMQAFQAEIADVIRGTRHMGVEIRQTLALHHRELAEQDAARARDATERLAGSFEAALARLTERTEALEAALARNAERTTAEAAARLAALSDRAATETEARAARAEARVGEAASRAMDAAEARLERAAARFEAAANRASAALQGSAAQVGRAALAELAAHRRDVRAEIATALTLARAANDAPRSEGTRS